MISERAPLIVILLAGDNTTAVTLDSLLYEVQQGVNSLDNPTLSQVYCFYCRITSTGTTEVNYYQIKKDTLTFIDSTQLDISHYPPPHPDSTTLSSGTLAEKLTQFTKGIRVAGTGPIRVLIGAHGSVDIRLSSTNWTDVFEMLWGFAFDRDIPKRTWRQRKEFLKQKRFPQIARPAAFISTENSNPMELSLDDAAGALRHLGENRLTTLILHSCYLSCIEAITAFSTFPHQIACETLLWRTMLLQRWFPTLQEPTTSKAQLTSECYLSIKTEPPNANGHFSSHNSERIDELLALLNELGSQLTDALTCNPADVIGKITQAFYNSRVTSFNVDVCSFCSELNNALIVSSSTPDALASLIRQIQIEKLLWADAENRNSFEQHQGISMFLPEPGNSSYTPSDLPASFQIKAQKWCDFLRTWMAVTAVGSRP